MAKAHPADQFRMEIAVSPKQVAVKVMISISFMRQYSANNSGSLDDAPLLKFPPFPHFHFTVDGQPVEWREEAPAQKTDASGDWLGYDATYSFAKDPTRLHLSMKASDTAGVVVIFHSRDGTMTTHLLSAQQTVDIDLPKAAPPPSDVSVPKTAATPSLSPNSNTANVFGDYVEHGVWHILTGYDHMLFMAALVLAATSLWDLVKVVTAFTSAHTITLTLAVFDVAHLSSRIVEPMIALSIVVVALQNMFYPRSSRGWTRLAIAFGFGLFHGLGFAGGLLEAMAGLGGMTVVTAIVAFSVGVELGHQFVVIPLYTARVVVSSASGTRGECVSRSVTFWGSALIALAGTYYLFVALFPRA